MKIPTVKLNPVNISKEQMQAVRKNIFVSEYEKFFRHVDKYSLNSNIYFFGNLLNRFGKNGMEEEPLKAILRGVNKLKANKPPVKKISLVNVIYSTALKRITPENLISGTVKPETYRRVIDDSIRTYRQYPIGKGVDHRHILGRLVSLKNMSQLIKNKLHFVPQKFSPIEWTQNEQVHLVYTLERIYSQYKQTNSDFVVKKYRNQHPQKRADTTFESVAKSYFNNIIKLLWMIQDNILIMMRNPLLNYNDIKDNIDQVLYYSGKLSYNDTVRMPISFDIFEKLKKVNSQLEAEMKKNSKSAE